MSDILAKIMDVELDFGNEAVKDVDTKLHILKFGYSWVEEVEKEERLMKEVKEPVLEQKDKQKNKCQIKPFTKETKEITREPLLDFGDGPVVDLDAKLEILKFPYSWAEKVEEEERGTKEVNEPALKQESEPSVKIFREERNEIPREPLSDFGDRPVTNLEEKLEILKFPYNWAEKVEEEERETKLLCNEEDENENDNYFVPRRLFLFGVEEFKSDLKQSIKNTKQPDVPEKSTDMVCSKYDSVAKVATIRKRNSIGRKIKTFLGLR
ncbi:uncharacterized protein LOC133192929 [Saccostrea echinata]|uniref:uncharacterized protein LOC133192929 n=1 Tax=Saccostrea echinata TaxID=191078 RepID=UPI002A80A80F|nr:uncharacterized protein LOC133192929 [Saccostrea echinata]